MLINADKKHEIPKTSKIRKKTCLANQLYKLPI